MHPHMYDSMDICLSNAVNSVHEALHHIRSFPVVPRKLETVCKIRSFANKPVYSVPSESAAKLLEHPADRIPVRVLHKSASALS